MKNKRNHIANFISLGIFSVLYGVVLLIYFLKEETDIVILAFVIPSSVFGLLAYLFTFLYIRSGFNRVSFIVCRYIFGVGGLAASGAFLGIQDIAAILERLLLFANGLFVIIGYYIILVFIPLDLKFKPMNYGQKVLEVLLQIALLPISLFIWICCVGYGIFLGYHLGKIIAYHLHFKKMKAGGYNTYYWRYDNKPGEDEIYSGYYDTKTYEIKDSYGEVIGSIETRGDYVPGLYESYGVGWNKHSLRTDMEEVSLWFAWIAFPCRIISLILSIVALFIPWIYVSAMTPKCDKKAFNDLSQLDRNKHYGDKQNIYNDKLFLFLDLLIPTSNK